MSIFGHLVFVFILMILLFSSFIWITPVVYWIRFYKLSFGCLKTYLMNSPLELI